MKFRSIPSPVYTEAYILESFKYCNESRNVTIYLQHAISFKNFRVRITFENATAFRFTPLDCGFSEYCEERCVFVKENPEYRKDYRGVVEIIGTEVLTGRVRGRNQKHYLIITEDEYVEVAADADPIIEDLNPFEKA